MANPLPSPPPAPSYALEHIELERTNTDLRDWISAALEPLRAEAGRLDVAFELVFGAELPCEVVLDADKIAWAVATLAGNALRYVRRGTRWLPGGAVGVALDYVPATAELIITVRDDGPGIPEEKLRSLFERGPGERRALGLALKLVRDVAVAHGGSLAVASRTDLPDQGTSVTLRIPAPALVRLHGRSSI